MLAFETPSIALAKRKVSGYDNRNINCIEFNFGFVKISENAFQNIRNDDF